MKVLTQAGFQVGRQHLTVSSWSPFHSVLPSARCLDWHLSQKKICLPLWPLETMNVSLFEKRVSVDAIKLKILWWNHPGLPGWVPDPTSILIKETEEKTDTREPCKDEAVIRVSSYKPRPASSHQNLKESRNRISPRTSRESTALLITWFWISGLQSVRK